MSLENVYISMCIPQISVDIISRNECIKKWKTYIALLQNMEEES